MAEITAAAVKELREKSGAGMMDCKKALTASDGDIEKAVDWLREKGLATAAKKAGRVAAQGLVAMKTDGKQGVVVEVNSETDFVAKNPEFLKMAADAAKLIAEKAPADVAALSALELEGKTLDAIRTALVGKIGENMTFRRFKRLEAKGKLHKYVHGGSKIATLVDVEGGDDEVAHDIAMHIAASKPKALNAEGIDPALIETERRVAIEKAKEAGKPEAMLERIADGTVKKFLKEVTLLDQPFVKDDKVTIAQLLKSKNANVADFALFVVGEGLEKRNDDFAAEVAAQTAAAQKA